MEFYNLVSLGGMIVLMVFAWLLSAHRKVINWRVIMWGIILQFAFGVFVFLVPAGTKVFLLINDAVVAVMDSASAGSRFLFGRLALPPGATDEAGEASLGFFLAFQAFPMIIFFSALMSILYFLNIMPIVIRAFAYVFSTLMRVSGAESLYTAGCIFAGVESSFTVRPYLERMTRSELCTLLTAGMATVSSNVLAVYVFSLKDQMPMIAGHLISASVLNAPAALVMSKLIYPETDTPETLRKNVELHYQREKTLFEAIINGATAGLKLIAGIVALLLAVLGLVAMLDMGMGWIGGKVNALLGISFDWHLKGLLGYVFYPFTLAIGVTPADAWPIAQIVGERLIVTEVTAYRDLAVAMRNHVIADPRSAVIATYALCGFAHVASLAIFIGGIAAIAPNRTHALSEVGVRALVAATLACMMTACVAGIFFSHGSLLLAH